MPTAHFEPAGAASIVLMMKSVEPTRSAAWQVSYLHSGWQITRSARDLLAQQVRLLGREALVHRAVAAPHDAGAFARASRPAPPADRGADPTGRSSRAAGRARRRCCAPGARRAGRRCAASGPTPSERRRGRSTTCRRARRACRTNALMAAVEFMYVIGTTRVAELARERVPRLLHVGDVGHVGHRAAGAQVGQDHALVRLRQDVGALGHEVHAAEHDEVRVGRGPALRQLVRVAEEVGVLHDLVALVVMAEDDQAPAERELRRADARVELGVGQAFVGGERKRRVDGRGRAHAPESTQPAAPSGRAP